MRPLVALRRAAPYDPDFVERSPLFEPLRAAASRIAHHRDFPSPQELDAVFDGDPPVHFVPARPRRRDARAPAATYDRSITLDGHVPTRSRCWHDLMNALVWGTFPRAKAALHARQHRAIAERTFGGNQAGGNRTRELDALALLDEGGVVILATDASHVEPGRLAPQGALGKAIRAGEVEATVFGHAIFESLTLGVRPAIVAAVALQTAGFDGSRARRVDAALAEALGDPSAFGSPTELRRIDLGEVVSAST